MLSIIILTVFAVLKLGSEFYRLVWEPGWLGAIDLKMRHREIHAWFAGKPVYYHIQSANYPPVSYILLWPLLGWLPLNPARWFWALTSISALAYLSFLIVRSSEAENRLEKVLVVLMLLSMNATGVTIGNGQLGLHILPALVAGLVLVSKSQITLRKDMIIACLFLVGLVKPNMTAPFFWIVLFVPGRLRPALLVVSGYVALTLLAASFQEENIIQLLQSWTVVSVKYTSGYGYLDLHLFLHSFGLGKWSLKASLLVLTVHGFWVYRYRFSDIWLLLGVTAIIARLWTYHGLYDDVLILLPMAALFRIVKQAPFADTNGIIAGLLLAINLATMLTPARMHFFWPEPWPLLFATVHAVVWCGTLIFLYHFSYHFQKNGHGKTILDNK